MERQEWADARRRRGHDLTFQSRFGFISARMTCVGYISQQLRCVLSRPSCVGFIMTVFIEFIIVVCVLGGAVAFLKALLGQTRQGETKACPRCQKLNPSNARYCGQCGEEL